VLTLARGQKVYLPPTGREGPRVLAAHAEQNEFGHIAEIEAYAAPVGTTIFAYLVPDDIGLVGEFIILAGANY
jgi:hypothetical protein